MGIKSTFLDTSIQISLQSEDDESKEYLEQAVNSFDLAVSSSYVKMEFQRAFIRKGLIYLYNVAKRCNSFPAMIRILSQLPPVQKRRLTISLKCLSNFFEPDRFPGPECMEKLLYYLPLAIEFSWNEFDSAIDGMVDETGCVKGKEKPIRNGEVYEPFTKCKASNKRCKIDEFFEKNREQFEKMLKKLKAISPQAKDDELLKIENILVKALRRPQYMLEWKNCWNCGDAIIAAECPADTTLLTTNIKHSKPLLEAIQKKLSGITLSQVKPKQIAKK